MPIRRPARPADAPDRWLILCRQSDTDDEGERSLSLTSQESVLRDAAAAVGAIVVTAVRDADLRGYQDETQRPALAEALERAGRYEYDVLAVWDISRLARKLSLQERVLEHLERHGVRLYSHREPHANTPMLRQILGAVAEEQTRVISGHVRRALRERRQQGKWHGRAPFGYTRVDGELAIDDQQAPWVRAIFTQYRDGAAIMEIARWLNDQQVPRDFYTTPWSWHTVTKVLQNAAYVGLIPHRPSGIPTAGHHPHLIDRALFDAVQRRRDTERGEGTIRHRHGRFSAAETFLGGGRIRCQCGRALGANRRQQHLLPRLVCRVPSTHDRTPSCGMHPRSIAIWKAEGIVRERIADDLGRIQPWRQISGDVRKAIARTIPDAGDQRRDVERRIAALELKQARARDLYINGRIDLPVFDATNQPLQAQRDELVAQLADLPDANATVDSLATLGRYAVQARTSLPRADIPTMTALMTQLGAVAHLDPTAPDGLRVDYADDVMILLAASRLRLH